MSDSHKVCTQCGEPLDPHDKFCPDCGHKVEAVAIVDEGPDAPDAEQPTETLDAAPPDAPKSRRRVLAIAGVAAVGLVLAGAAWWGLSQQSEAKEQYLASGPVLVSTLDDMSAVQSTEMVQEVAGGAQEQVTGIDAVLQADPQAKGADRLTTLRDAFAALAALTAYEENNTDVWTDNRQPLMATLDTLTSYGEPVQAAAASGEDAARTLDDLTAHIDKAMDRYRRQVAKARAEAKENRVDARAYHAQMEALIDRYTALRNDTGTFVDTMYERDLYMYEVIDYFTRAATDRREVGNQMAALRPPQAMRGAHQRIVTVIGDGADAINSAVAALEDAACYSGECYFEFDSQWEQFQTESERITAQYGDAYDTWQAQMAKELRAVKGADLPPKPDL